MKIKVKANHFLKDLITLKKRNKIFIKKNYNNNLIKKDNNYPVEKMILIPQIKAQNYKLFRNLEQD